MTILESKEYLEQRLPGIKVEVMENYTNKHAINATRFIFSKEGEKSANLMFKKGFNLSTDVLDGVIEAIRKKFANAKAAPLVPEPQEEVQKTDRVVPMSKNSPSYDLYLAAKKVVETYEAENPMT